MEDAEEIKLQNLLFMNSLLQKSRYHPDLQAFEVLFPMMEIFTNVHGVCVQQLPDGVEGGANISHNPLSISPSQIFSGNLLGRDASLNLDAMTRQERAHCQELGEYWIRKKVLKGQCVQERTRINNSNQQQQQAQQNQIAVGKRALQKQKQKENEAAARALASVRDEQQQQSINAIEAHLQREVNHNAGFYVVESFKLQQGGVGNKQQQQQAQPSAATPTVSMMQPTNSLENRSLNNESEEAKIKQEEGQQPAQEILPIVDSISRENNQNQNQYQYQNQNQNQNQNLNQRSQANKAGVGTSRQSATSSDGLVEAFAIAQLQQGRQQDIKYVLRNFSAAQQQFVRENIFAHKFLKECFTRNQEKIDHFKTWASALRFENAEQFQSLCTVTAGEKDEEYKNILRELIFQFYQNHAALMIVGGKMRSEQMRKMHLRAIPYFLLGIVDPASFSSIQSALMQN